MITFGLAPYFLDTLKERVKAENDYVLLFDESLNRKNKMKQMDMHIRIWHNELVETHYLSSEFPGHATSSVLEDTIEKTLNENGFARKKLLQLSMDGPAVN